MAGNIDQGILGEGLLLCGEVYARHHSNLEHRWLHSLPAPRSHSGGAPGVPKPLHVVRLALFLSFQAEVVEEQFDAMSSRHRDMPGAKLGEGTGG